MDKIYVGLKLNCTSQREVFRAATAPTDNTHGAQYGAVIGPFRTVRAAEFMRDYGRGNPHCLTVADAERLAQREYQPKTGVRCDCKPGQARKVRS